MMYYDGDTVWLPPIRYWEDPTPERCTVVERQGGDHLEHLYVYHEGYGHNVYVPLPVFYEENHARRYAALKTSIYKLVLHDEGGVIADRILANRDIAPIKFLMESFSEEGEEQ